MLHTPFKKAGVPTPSGDPAGDGGTVGGFDMGEGGKETPNGMSGLPRQRTTFPVKGGASGPGEQVEMPPVKSPGTFKSGGV